MGTKRLFTPKQKRWRFLPPVRHTRSCVPNNTCQESKGQGRKSSSSPEQSLCQAFITVSTGSLKPCVSETQSDTATPGVALSCVHPERLIWIPISINSEGNTKRRGPLMAHGLCQEQNRGWTSLKGTGNRQHTCARAHTRTHTHPS